MSRCHSVIVAVDASDTAGTVERLARAGYTAIISVPLKDGTPAASEVDEALLSLFGEDELFAIVYTR